MPWPIQCYFLHFHCLSHTSHTCSNEVAWRNTLRAFISMLHRKCWIVHPELKTTERQKLSSKFHPLITFFKLCLIKNIYCRYVQWINTPDWSSHPVDNCFSHILAKTHFWFKLKYLRGYYQFTGEKMFIEVTYLSVHFNNPEKNAWRHQLGTEPQQLHYSENQIIK